MVVAAQGAEEDVKAPTLPDTDQDYYIWASQIIAALMSNEQILMSILSLIGKILSVIWTVNSSTPTTGGLAMVKGFSLGNRFCR